jgi:two-component system cell cycle sensor histidine kinase/response regulator CckA
VTDRHAPAGDLPADRWSAFADSAQDAHVCVDGQGRIVDWTRSAETLFGWTRDEASGRALPDLVLAEPERAAHLALLSSLAGEDPSSARARIEVAGQHRSGRPIALEVSICSSRAAGGVEICEVFRDVSSRHVVEQELARKRDVEMLGMFAASVAHDFNNALVAIMAFGEMLRESLPEGGQQQEDAGEIVSAARRGTALTRQLLSYTRRQHVEPRVIDTNDELESLLKVCRRLLREDVSLEVTIPQRLSRLHIDPAQLEQVLMNLVVNARDAMPQGGVLEISARNILLPAAGVDTPGLAPGKYVEIAVSDAGTGIEPAIQKRIFEPLFTTKPVGSGTGLGLANVLDIVSQAGGAITLTSELGKGSTFRLYFPRAVVATSLTLPSIRPAKNLRGTEAILVVEDDEAVRTVVRRVLQQAGYAVHASASPGEGLIMAEQSPPALLVTDVVLPQVSGVDLARRLLRTQPDLKVLLMSGYARAETTAGWLFLAKPFLPDALLLRVRQALDGTPID